MFLAPSASTRSAFFYALAWEADSVANYCCIADCNEIPNVTTNYNGTPGFAYTIDPNGAPDPNNYHLSAAALCINHGDPDFADETEADYDGEARLMGIHVDIGADEVNPNCGDVENDVDWNADGLVNLNEFSKFSAAWLSHDPNDPSLADPNLAAAWNPACNLDATGDSTYVIDLADLEIFIEDVHWLWVACWKLEEIQTATATTQTESLTSQPLAMSAGVYSLEAETTESEPEVSADTLIQVIGFLDEVATEMPDNAVNIADMRAILMNELTAILEFENQ